MLARRVLCALFGLSLIIIGGYIVLETAESFVLLSTMVEELVAWFFFVCGIFLSFVGVIGMFTAVGSKKF